MEPRTKLAVLVGTLALAVTPATASAVQPEDPGSQGKAQGVQCQGKSHKHVKGEKGTEFSRCVTAAAKEQQQV
jgi:hypothetical protein